MVAERQKGAMHTSYVSKVWAQYNNQNA